MGGAGREGQGPRLSPQATVHPGSGRGGFLALLQWVHWGRHTNQRQPHPEKETRGPCPAGRRPQVTGAPPVTPALPRGPAVPRAGQGREPQSARPPRSARTHGTRTSAPRGSCKGGPEVAPGSGGHGNCPQGSGGG